MRPGFVSRGFRGRRLETPEASRLPPGQHLTRDFPVLSAGPTPRTPLQKWDFTVNGLVVHPQRWTWEQFLALPKETVKTDIHCVTKWSKLDTSWEGVSLETLLEAADPTGDFLIAHCDGDYTTNLSLDDVTGGRAWVAYRYNGEPLAPEHGGPARLLVPHLYFWKSAKWVRRLEIVDTDTPGFWESVQAERSYSIASAPEEERVAITVERLDDGEVSPYLVDEIRIGDQLELRGPIGGYFTWTASDGGPLFLVAGGSGIVPLMAMIRHRAAAKASIPVSLLFSSRGLEEIIYREELDRLIATDSSLRVIHTLTRSQPEGWTGYRRRIDREMLEEVAWPASARPVAFICGPTRMVEGVATMLTELGYEAPRVKTERFGPTGGG